MPRGRWVFDEDLSRAMWQQILRGPRPPSVQWPRNQSNANVHQQQRSGGQPHSRNRRRWQSSGTRQRVQPTEARNVRESRTPDDDAVANQAHIEKLEKAIEILGEESPQAQGLIAALKQARERAVVPPIGVRLDSCQAFVERARKRLTVAEEEVTKALRTKSTREFELEQGLARLAQLREEAASREREVPARGVVADPPATVQTTSAEEVNLLRATVAELRREQVSLMAQLAQQTETARAMERSGRMETLIDDADADLRASQRFTPY